MDNQNIPDINEDDRTQQDATGNMYSYRDDNQNVKETGAMRRSLGDNNPNANFPQNNFGSDNVQNYNNNGDVGLQYSQQDNNDSKNESSFWVTYLIFGCIEAVLITILSFFLENQILLYDDEYSKSGYDKEIIENIYFNYELLRDMNIMVFIGFGMMNSILRRSSWTSISINILLIAFSIQIALLFNYLWHDGFKEIWDKEYLDFVYLMKAIFISTPTLISLGCVIGRLSFMQYLIMSIMETILCSLNYQLCERKLESIDVGGAMYIHTFGAIFGISISMVLFCSKKVKSEIQKYNQMNKSSYFSNLTTFLGIIFLFCFFPSFNSALASSDKDIETLSTLNSTANITIYNEIEFQKQRGRINTYFSLIGSVIASFITSGLFNKGRFIFEQIFFGSLSGGIIISGCCTVCFDYGAAMIIGTIGSVIIITFLSKIKPFFIKSGFKDIFNVSVIHGLSGILGALVTPMFISDFERRFFKNNEEKYKERFKYIFRDETRSNLTQAGIQVGALFITLGVSFVGGIATGYLMKISTCGKINQYFTDIEFFKEEEDNIFDYVESNTLVNVDINNPSLFPKKMIFSSSDQKKEKISEIGGNQPSYYN
jgi:ammonium transporter Rh